MNAQNSDALKSELEYYLKNQKELVNKYNGKYLLIVGQEVIKSFDNELDAYQYAIDNYEEGKFLIQLCIPGDDSYSQTFYTRVVSFS